MPLEPQLKQQLESLAHLIRRDSIDLTTQSGSGHPTTCMSAADIMSWVFFREIRLDQHNLDHPLADKYIFSKGHAAPLLYALMYRLGYLEADELKSFREIGSRLEGHPTLRLPGVVAATGSLGQGLSVAAGMAEVYQREGRDQKVYVLMGDGEINEGQVWEAAMLAGSRKLSNLIGIVDRNRIQQSNFCDQIVDAEPLDEKFRSFGWETVRINGHDFDAIAEAFAKARANTDKPFMIVADTEKGYGVSFLSGQLKRHGVALSAAEKEQAYAELPVADDLDIAALTQSRKDFGPVAELQPVRLSYSLSSADFDPAKKYAARAAYGDALKKLGGLSERIWVLDGDTSNSTYSDRFAGAYPDRHLECGIAEQNLVSAAVGVAATGKVAVSNSFARFFERAYDQIEMGAYSQANFKIVGSHVGISIGEDGASQMAMADCGFMRAIPDAVVLSPSDYVSAFKLTQALLEHEGFCYMRTFRGAASVLYSADESFPLGDYKVLRQSESDAAVVLATGYVVHEALKAADKLAESGLNVRVIDVYSLKPFNNDKLRAECESLGIKHVFTLEDHYATGGLGDLALDALNGSGIRVEKVAVQGWPESGSPEALLAKYGIDAAALYARVKQVLS
ncbi:MAG: transketolase [Candidatus Sericytochromatia bacterium]|nr:transketolase [Candidatus Sericytochromatia bacterium]